MFLLWFTTGDLFQKPVESFGFSFNLNREVFVVRIIHRIRFLCYRINNGAVYGIIEYNGIIKILSFYKDIYEFYWNI